MAEQIRSLQEVKEMAATYGYDLSRPALTAREVRDVPALSRHMGAQRGWWICVALNPQDV